MKHFAVIFFLIFLTADSMFSQVVFDKLIIEDEVVPNSQGYDFTFKFQNTGNETLKISKVETSCSCTIPKLEKEVYFPREKGEINGIFNIGERTGLQEKEIIVHTNDISQPKIKLLLKIKILNPIEIKPRLIYWERNAKLETKTIKLTINDPKWKIESILFDKTKLVASNILTGNSQTIEILPLSTKESLHDLIKIKLKNDIGKTKTFAVHALIK